MSENNLTYHCPICITDFTDEGIQPFEFYIYYVMQFLRYIYIQIVNSTMQLLSSQFKSYILQCNS